MKKRILVVDDELAFNEMIKLTLEVTGRYQVRTIAYPSQAVPVARAFKPDLILLDCMMPDMDGGEVAGRIEADKELAGVPVAFLSATVSGPETAPSRCYTGLRTYLPKTLPLQQLVKFIDNLTSGEPAARG